MAKQKELTINERIERARLAKRQAQFALLSREPVPDPKPVHRPEGYYRGQYIGLTWRGKKIIIPKGRFGY